jgi:ArsR family transcriptional regulator
MAFLTQRMSVIITFKGLNMIDKLSIENQSYDAPAQFFKVLTHPTRLAILAILRDGEHCVCHIEAHLGFRQAYISQQLAVLREAGLIQDRRDGWNIFYRVADPKIYTILDAVESVFGESHSSRPKENVACPCPKCNGG